MTLQVKPGYVAGCIGRITQLHALYYAREVGFGVNFEAKVASELSAFCRGYSPDHSALLLAMNGDCIEGSVVIDGSHVGTQGAHLRWFIVSDESRGAGAGNMLLAAALDFCDRTAYRKVYLWTFDQLAAARHLYEKHDFVLAHTQRGSQWGREVNEQRFERVGP